jgi:hypothetical protein
MTLPGYLADVARELSIRSAAIRRDFATHRLSAGENRQDLVEQFLDQHLPKRYGVSTGLVFTNDGLFSNQADLIVVDHLNNAPLYGTSRNKLWPVEAVYALAEVKTSISPSDIQDAVAKGRRFKTLRREFLEGTVGQHIRDSLFVIWSFDSPNPEVVKTNLLRALEEVPIAEQPDLVVVPDRLVAHAGTYLQLAKLGQPGSTHRRQLEAQHGPTLSSLKLDPVEVYNLGENSLMAWYLWFDSWLRRAGPRLTDPAKALSENN